jgi:hypothetical protein
VAGLAPAILGHLGIAVPESFHVPTLPSRREQVTGYAYSEVLKEKPTYLRLHRRAVVGKNEKLLVDNAGDEMFYDLATDPAETHPVPTPAFAGVLRQALAAVTDRLVVTGAARTAPVDAATRERLRVLGYTD